MTEENDKLALTKSADGGELTVNISGAQGLQVNQKDYVELAASLMQVAQNNMRADLVRIAAQEFDYIIRRRREIAVETSKNQGILEFIKRKQAALERGEFVVDTISGRLTFLDEELQPWL